MPPPDGASTTRDAVDELLNTAPCGFLSFADDGRVRSINATLLEMLGYKIEDVVGEHIERLFNVGTRIFYQTHWFPLLRLHGHAEEVFLLLRTRDGQSLGVLSYAKRSRTNPSSYDCVLVHVAERAKYEDELLRAKKALEQTNSELQRQKSEAENARDLLEAQAVELELQQQQLQEVAETLRITNAQLEARSAEAEELRNAADEANHAKSAFLAMMSHELRTPLNAIGGYLQILELGIAGPISDAQREILQRLDKSSRHLLRLINEVLNLARIEAGHVHYDMTTTRLIEVLDDVLPMIEPQFASKAIHLNVDVADGIKVRADVEKLSQVLLNLLSNAFKFTGQGGNVVVNATTPEDGAVVEIRVRDSGTGIPADKLDAIFQPFVQVDSSRTRAAEGSGLGLAISRDLARGMGGDLTVSSVVGEGSTFTLTMANPE